MKHDYRSYYDKDFLGAWDITGPDLVLTIKQCKGGELTAPGGKKSKKPVVYFNEIAKGFALNSTNGKAIAKMYGNYVEDWKGGKIALYKSTTRNPQDGGEIDCLRVRPEPPELYEPPPPLQTVLDTIKVMQDKTSRDAAKALMERLEADDEIKNAVAAYQARVAELRTSQAEGKP